MLVRCWSLMSSVPAGLWTLHTTEGRNIQLHFLDFDVEAAYDTVEVRDGAGPDSALLGEDLLFPRFLFPSRWRLMVMMLRVLSSCPHRKQRPRPGFLLDNQPDGGPVLHGLLGRRPRLQGQLHVGRQPGLPWYWNRACGSCLHLYSCCHVEINKRMVFILCKQLRVRMASSSVGQEAVSTVTGGVTVWLTAPIPLTRQTVVGWRVLKPQIFRRVDNRFMSTRLSFLKGKWIQSSPVPGWFHPPYRLRRHLELWVLCLHLPVPWIQVPHLPVLTCRCISDRRECFLDFVWNSSGLEMPRCCRLCRKIRPSQT